MADIRKATANDLDTFLALGMMMHAESPRFSKSDFSLTKCEAIFKALLDNPRGLLLVAEIGDVPVGIFAGFATEHYFGNSLTSSDLLVYVDRGFRGGTTGIRFVKQYKDWATSIGVVDIGLSVSTAIGEFDRTVELFERQGFQRAGASLWCLGAQPTAAPLDNPPTGG